MKLIDEITGVEIKTGMTRETFRGEKVIVTGAKPPHKPGSTGRVYVRCINELGSMEYFPSVIGAKWSE
jgi:hypothetical protein